MKNFKNGQLIKSKTSNQVYWIKNIADGTITAENGMGKFRYFTVGDTDLAPINLNDPNEPIVKFRLSVVNH